MKRSTMPIHLSHETIGTKGQLATGKIEGIWGETFDPRIECGGNSGLFPCKDKDSRSRLLAIWVAFLWGCEV